MITPVAKISLSFQLSGTGDGFTLSFDMVIIVPTKHNFNFMDKFERKTLAKIFLTKTRELTIVKNGNDENHERREVKFPDDRYQHKTKL